MLLLLAHHLFTHHPPFLVQSLKTLPVPLHHLGTTDDAFYFPHGSHLLFGTQIKIICLIELGPRTFSRRTTWWCDLRTEGGLLNELESEPSAFHSHQVAGLCSHTQMISAQNGIGAPQSPSVLQQAYICASESPVVTPDLMWEQLPVKPKGQIAKAN